MLDYMKSYSIMLFILYIGLVIVFFELYLRQFEYSLWRELEKVAFGYAYFWVQVFRAGGEFVRIYGPLYG